MTKSISDSSLASPLAYDPTSATACTSRWTETQLTNAFRKSRMSSVFFISNSKKAPGAVLGAEANTWSINVINTLPFENHYLLRSYIKYHGSKIKGRITWSQFYSSFSLAWQVGSQWDCRVPW